MTDHRDANPSFVFGGLASLVAVVWLAPAAHGQDGSRVARPPAPPTPTSADAATTAPQQPAPIAFNFSAGTEPELIRFIGDALGCRVVVPANLSDEGTIEWVDQKRYSAEEALTLVDAVLRTRGLRITRDGDTLVAERIDPDLRRPPVLWTRVLPLVQSDAAAFGASLRAVLPEAITLAPIEQPAPAALIVTSRSLADLRLVEPLLNAVDRADTRGDLVAVKLSHTMPAEARAALLDLIGFDGSIANVAVWEDGPARALILRGERPRLDAALAALAVIDAGPSPKPAGLAPQAGEIAVTRFSHAAPDEARAIALALLPERARRALRMVTATDRRAVLAAGTPTDLALLHAVLETSDRATSRGRIARLVRLSADDAARVVEDARRDLDLVSGNLILDFDAQSRELLLVGSAGTVDDALARIARLSGGRAWEREAELLRVERDAPDAAALLAQSIRTALPQRGSAAARFDAAGDLNAVLVSGEPGTIDLAAMILDVRDPTRGEVRAACQLRIPTPDASKLIDETRGAASASLDSAASVVRASGTQQTVADFERALDEARGLRQRNRIARIVPTGTLGSRAIATEFTALLGAAVPVEPTRSVPMAEVRPLPSIGALYIEGEPAQVALMGRLIAARESGELAEDTPLRILEIRCARASTVARGLRERFALREESEQRTKPVFVGSDDAGDALAVAMRPDMLVEVARTIDELDAREDGLVSQPREVFSSTLAQSDPAVVARALNGLFELAPMPRDAFGHALPHLRDRRELFASADPTTRMVWVEAARERTVSLDAIVAQLDRLALSAEAEVRLYRLERGDIVRVVQNLRDLAARGNLSAPTAGDAAKPPAIVVDADAMSRTLIVVGDATVFAKTEEVLRQLGVLAAPRGLRVIDAGGLDPEQLRSRALRLAELEPKPGDAPLVVASADAARGIVSAVGDEAALERFAAACRRLVPKPGDALAASGITLRQRSAESVVPVLDGISLGSMRPASLAAGRGDVAVVAGSRDSVIVAEALVRALDSAGTPTVRVLDSIPVRDAALPAEAIAEWLSSRGLAQQQALSAEVRATSDGERLIVSAHTAPIGSIGAIERDLGIAGGADGNAVAVRIVPLRHARADTLAKLIDQCADTDGAVATVRADPTSNALVIAAPTFWCATLASLVESLDTADAARDLPVYLTSGGGWNQQISVLPVRNAAVERAAELVREILGGTRVTEDAGAKVRPLVSVGEDAEGRRLLVSGRTEICQLAERLVVRLDEPGGSGEPFTAAVPWLECAEIELAHLDAEVAATVLGSVLADRTRWPASLNDAVRKAEPVVAPRVVADRENRRIFVSAAPQLMVLARMSIARLDVDRAPTERWELRVYPIAGDRLSAATNAARQAIDGRKTTGGQRPVLRLAEVPDAEVLIATGEPSWLDAVDLAVRSVDVRGPRDAARVRMVSLAHTEAVRLASLPAALLAAEQSKADARKSDVAMPLRAIADAKANEIALLATPAALDLAEEILVELDAAPDASMQRSLRLYELEAGEAAVVAKSIVDLFETDDGSDPLPTVRVQPSRNSLLVRATDKQRVAIDGLVARADAKAPARARVVRALTLATSAHSTAEVDAALGRLLSPADRVATAVDASRNTIIAFGAPAAIEHASWIMDQLVAYPGALDEGVRRFELPASAEPRAIAAQACTVLGQIGIDWRRGAAGPKLIPEAHAVIVDRRDERAISYIASAEGARIVEALLAVLVRGQNAGPIAFRHVRLANAAPARVGGLLRDEASRADGTLLVVDDLEPQSILLVGAPREVEAAARTAARIDRQDGSMRSEEVRSLPLRGLRASEAVTLAETVPSFLGAGTAIVPESATNSVVIRGDAPAIQPFSELLVQLDDPTAKSLPPFEAIQIINRKPSEVAAAVLSAMKATDPARRDRMRVVADDGMRLLFVRADAALLAELRAAVEAADTPLPVEVPPVEVSSVDGPPTAETPATGAVEPAP